MISVVRGGRRTGRAGGLLVVGLILTSGGAVAPLAVWLAVRHRPGWTEEGVADAVGNAVQLGTGIAVAIGCVLLAQWLAERRARSVPATGTSAQVEAWRSRLREAVVEKRVDGPTSQLGQMVHQTTVLDVPAAHVGLGAGARGQPRIRVGDRVAALPEITGAWDRSPARLVILGDPGYGKTVAVLALLAHINGAEDRAGAPVAELFSLSEWYRWETDHAGAPLAEWLADELVTSYPELDRAVARQLIRQRLVIPVLDGLDEVPDERRAVCKEAIDAYAGRAAPFRPFLLTCRVDEYEELAPGWVTADHHVRLVGLDPEQVADVLRERTVGDPDWEAVRDRLAGGDRRLASLFRSPLRLATALQVYRHGGADELLRLDPTEAEHRLWDRLLGLDQGSATFGGADAAQTRSWLEFLADGLRRERRQRFWLHDLHAYAPDRRAEIGRFTALLGTVGALLAAGAVAAPVSIAFSPRAALYTGIAVLLAGTTVWVAVRLSLLDPAYEPEFVRPAVHQRRLPLRTHLLAPRYELAAAIGVGLLVGYLGRPAHGALVALGLGVLIGLSALVDEYVAGWAAVAADPPPRLRRRGDDPHAVLRTSLRSGLLWGLGLGQFVGFVLGLMAALVAGGYDALWGVGLAQSASTALTVGSAVFVLVGVLGGVAFAISKGVGPWLFHHWLRFRLARRGLLPRRLPQFLAWCAEPPRAWLRGPGGYEFRHRGLLDHLATDADGDGGGTADRDLQGDPDRAVAAEDESATDGDDTRRLPPVVPGVAGGTARTLFVAVAAIGIVLAFIGGCVATLGPEFTIDYVGGDEPEPVLEHTADGSGEPGGGVAVLVHQWDLEPGGDVRAEFRASAARPFLPGGVVLDSLHGDLALAGCDGVDVTWRVTAGGSAIAEGDLRPEELSSLGHIDIPGHRDRSTRFVLTARRTDRARCPAQLLWRNPGIDTPGVGTPF